MEIQDAKLEATIEKLALDTIKDLRETGEYADRVLMLRRKVRDQRLRRDPIREIREDFCMPRRARPKHLKS